MGKGKRKAGHLGFQAGEIAFIEDEMAALAAEYGLQVDGAVAASVRGRQQAKKARRSASKRSISSSISISSSVSRPKQQQEQQLQRSAVRLLALQVARLKARKLEADEGEGEDGGRLVGARLRALLPEGGALGRCVVPGCGCATGSRELLLDQDRDAELEDEDAEARALFGADVVRRGQCGRCHHGLLQHAVVLPVEPEAKKKKDGGVQAASARPSGGQRLLSALYALVRLVRVAGSVFASREWTRSGMALLEELLAHMRGQFAAGGTDNGQKSAVELQQEKQLVGELQALAKRVQQAIGAAKRDELLVQLACLCDQMYFHCYYACIVLYGRGCAAVPAPDAHFRQVLSFAPASALQLERFLNAELVVQDNDKEGDNDQDTGVDVLHSLALPLAAKDKSASDYKRALTQFETEVSQNPLLSVYHSRLQEGVRLFYEQGIGMNGEMDAVVLNPTTNSSSAPVSSKKKPQKKNYRRERKAAAAGGGDAEAGVNGGKAALVEMPSYPLLAQWRNNCRDWCCHLFAYATPTPESLKIVASYAPLVEMGAGTGYWSALLQQSDVDIVAYDKCPPSAELQSTNTSKHKGQQQNAYHGQVPPFCPLGTGGPEVLKQKDMAGRNLLLCYPPPGDDMAVNCARFFQGECLIHIGEWQGDTGDRRFEKELETRFTLEKEVVLPNWGNSAYHLTVWRRSSSGEDADDAESKVMSCFHCHQTLRDAVENGNREGDDFEDAPFKRCMLCKTNVYCSSDCAEKDQSAHAAEHAKRLVFLTDEKVLNFDNDAHYMPLVDVASLDTSEQDAVAKRTSNWNALVGKSKEGNSDEDAGSEQGGDEDDEEGSEEEAGEEEQPKKAKPARAAFAFNFST